MSAANRFEISQDILDSARMSIDELRVELDEDVATLRELGRL